MTDILTRNIIDKSRKEIALEMLKHLKIHRKKILQNKKINKKDLKNGKRI